VEIQHEIMDSILFELEKEKEEHLLSCDIGTTERKLSYGLSESILEKHMQANHGLNRNV
jgi:hypothetical protein